LRTHSVGQDFDQAGAFQTVSVRAKAEAEREEDGAWWLMPQ